MPYKTVVQDRSSIRPQLRGRHLHRPETMYPLQLVLKEILIASESTVGVSGETILEQYRTATQLKYVSVIVSSLPVLMLYPFVQKYFAQGVMIGSLKG